METEREWEVIVPEWVYVPDVAARIGVPDRQVRALIHERKLLAFRVGPNGAYAVPADFLVPVGGDAEREEIIPSLRGTLTLLADSGYSALDSLRWLYAPNELLGATPLAALRERRVATVRRAAQAIDY